MKISIAADHCGYVLAKYITNVLSKEHDVKYHGTFSGDSVDYPDFAKKVAQDVQQKIANFGILVCKTGIGMSIAANKMHGIRAALVHTKEEAILTRAHNDANILCLGEAYTSNALAISIINMFLSTKFEGGRHERRVEKIKKLEC